MIPKMPEEYKGEIKTNCGYTKSNPRKWNEKEIEWLNKMISDGFSINEIAESMDRTTVSVEIKRKRLAKKDNTYNKKHIIEKYEINEEFIKNNNFKSVLDLYCGEKSFYSGRELNITTNDINNEIQADYHMDAFKLICKLYSENKKYDFIDLDPFGSAYDCFDIAIKMAKKGIAITLGELGHKRWKRLDFVRSHYDIENIDNFTIENIIKYIQKIGYRNKKQLIVYDYKEWQNIGRIWFTIEPLKITEQWENN